MNLLFEDNVWLVLEGYDPEKPKRAPIYRVVKRGELQRGGRPKDGPGSGKHTAIRWRIAKDSGEHSSEASAEELAAVWRGLALLENPNRGKRPARPAVKLECGCVVSLDARRERTGPGCKVFIDDWQAALRGRVCLTPFQRDAAKEHAVNIDRANAERRKLDDAYRAQYL